MTVQEEIKYFGVGVCGGGLFLVLCLLALPDHASLLEVSDTSTVTVSVERLSASEYIKQMGPNTPAWNRPVKIKEASAKPLK